MKTLHVCNSFKSGGVKTFVESLIELNEMSGTSHDLMLIVGNGKNEILDKCKTYFLDYNRKNHISCIRKAAHIYRTYDAIMIHAAHPVIVFPLLFSRKKCFIFQHGMSVSSGPKLKRMMKKVWYSLIPILINARIICASEFAFNKARRLGILLQRKRCKIIPFGVRIDKKHLKRRAVNKDSIVVGMAGRLVSQKRHDLVLRSLFSLSSRMKLHLKIAGEGPDLVYLKKLADDIGKANVKVDYLGAVKNMDEFYSELDLVIFPSKGESFGLVVLEALTRSVPVAIFPDVGGCLPLIKNGRTGFILKEGIGGLESFWKVLAKSPKILDRQREIISRMDFGKYDIANTRKELEQLVKTI